MRERSKENVRQLPDLSSRLERTEPSMEHILKIIFVVRLNIETIFFHTEPLVEYWGTANQLANAPQISLVPASPARRCHTTRASKFSRLFTSLNFPSSVTFDLNHYRRSHPRRCHPKHGPNVSSDSAFSAGDRPEA
jgi:hypothetical protein